MEWPRLVVSQLWSISLPISLTPALVVRSRCSDESWRLRHILRHVLVEVLRISWIVRVRICGRTRTVVHVLLDRGMRNWCRMLRELGKAHIRQRNGREVRWRRWRHRRRQVLEQLRVQRRRPCEGKARRRVRWLLTSIEPRYIHSRRRLIATNLGRTLLWKARRRGLRSAILLILRVVRRRVVRRPAISLERLRHGRSKRTARDSISKGLGLHLVSQHNAIFESAESVREAWYRAIPDRSSRTEGGRSVCS